MNRSFDNIEYHPFLGHAYHVGYARLSGVWHIHKSGRGYLAICTTDRAPGVGCFHAANLAEVSNKLRSY